MNKMLPCDNSEVTQQMPSPPSWPLIGHLHLFKDFPDDPWLAFDEIRQKYGDLVSLQLGVHKFALASNYKIFRQILITKGDIFADRPDFPRHGLIFGGSKENSLALCNWNSVHKDRRKFCKRGIAPTNLSSRFDLLQACIDEAIVKFFESKLKVVTKNDLLLLTADVFMQFLCSRQYSHQSQLYQKFNQGCDSIFWEINQCYLIDFMPWLTYFGVCYSYLNHLKNTADFLRNFIDADIFDPRFEEHKSKQLKEPNDYLDTIIHDCLNKVTSLSLADYKVGFADLIAGHAAVANILFRCLGHLALDTSIQNQLLAETSQHTPQGQRIVLSDRPNLPLTEAVVLETLRLASSPYVPHVAKQDTTIDQYFVPKGTAILFNIYHLNLSSDLWQEPHLFRPERFIKPDSDGKAKLDLPKFYNPFSMGRRTCLGFKMVETICIVAIANLCRQFIIDVDDVDLARKLLIPKGTVALNPDIPCYKLLLSPRG